jgi:hypothetical protein
MMISSDLQGFEINTDVALVDPDWDEFATEHDKRFGLAISHFKSVVKGKAYDNEAIRLRVGPSGYYVQPKRFPAAFYGDTTPPTVEFVSEDEARIAAWEAVALYRSGEAQALTVLYRDGDPADIFFGYRRGGRRRYELGRVRAHLPLHLRVMVDGPSDTDLLGGGKGVLIYQRTRDGRHLLLRAAGRRQPYLGFRESLE